MQAQSIHHITLFVNRQLQERKAMRGSRNTGLNGATYLSKFRVNGNNIRCFKGINGKE